MQLVCFIGLLATVTIKPTTTITIQVEDGAESPYVTHQNTLQIELNRESPQYKRASTMHGLYMAYYVAGNVCIFCALVCSVISSAGVTTTIDIVTCTRCFVCGGVAAMNLATYFRSLTTQVTTLGVTRDMNPL